MGTGQGIWFDSRPPIWFTTRMSRGGAPSMPTRKESGVFSMTQTFRGGRGLWLLIRDSELIGKRLRNIGMTGSVLFHNSGRVFKKSPKENESAVGMRFCRGKLGSHERLWTLVGLVGPISFRILFVSPLVY